jgi:serine/threonine protein kinase
MPNLSLLVLLHGSQDYQLNWRQRLKIAVGVDFGLDYLHHGLRNAIIHGNMKPTNKILNKHLEPHIVDFGLAQVIRNNQRT